MEFVNGNEFATAWTMGFDRDGRELVVVAAKATFAISQRGEAPGLADVQVPLIEADRFSGEPGVSAPLYETDFVHRKPMCDVLVNGSAYAPAGRLTRSVEVGLAVGSMAKAFSVVGDRVWRYGIVGTRPSDPQPFDIMPVSYDRAYGGTETTQDDPTSVKTFLPNPVGKGFLPSKKQIDGKPLPNTEERGRPVVSADASYSPMAFGPIGRSWSPRAAYAGTYDEEWLNESAPFWPDDFDERYFQSAPADQQVPYPRGGERVMLRNLTPDGAVDFDIPTLPMPVWFIPHRGGDRRVDAVIDTIVIEPDLGRFTLTWRATQPMTRSCFDLKQIVVGQMSESRVRTRRYGNKPYYKGLAELARARQRR
jgi:hypothetical protein